MEDMQILGEFEIEKWSLAVLYDPGSGEIVHTHQCISIKGGEHPAKRQFERHAREALKKALPTSKGPRKLSILHINPRTFNPENSYKVAIKKRVLVKTSRGGSKRKSHYVT